MRFPTAILSHITMPNRHIDDGTKIQALALVFTDWEYAPAGKTIPRRRRLLWYRPKTGRSRARRNRGGGGGRRKGVAEAAVEIVRGLEGEERGGVGDKAAAKYHKIY